MRQRLKQYPLALALLVTLAAASVAVPVPEPVLREAYDRYQQYEAGIRSLLSNATTRDLAVYQMFTGSVVQVLASGTPLLGPIFAAYTAAQLGLAVKMLAVAELRDVAVTALSVFVDPSIWMLLLAYTIALVESAHLTQAVLRRTRPELELSFAMLLLAAVLVLMSATLVALMPL